MTHTVQKEVFGEERGREKHASVAWWGCGLQETDSWALRKLLQMAKNLRETKHVGFIWYVLVYFWVIPERPSKEAVLLPIYSAKQPEHGRVLSTAGTATAVTADEGLQSYSIGYIINPKYCITVTEKIFSIRRKQWEKVYFISDLVKFQIYL